MTEKLSDIGDNRLRLLDLLQTDFLYLAKDVRISSEERDLQSIMPEDVIDDRYRSKECEAHGDKVVEYLKNTFVTDSCIEVIASELEQAYATRTNFPEDLIDYIGIKSGLGIFDKNKVEEIESNLIQLYTTILLKRRTEYFDAYTPTHGKNISYRKKKELQRSIYLLNDWVEEYKRDYGFNPYVTDTSGLGDFEY